MGNLLGGRRDFKVVEIVINQKERGAETLVGIMSKESLENITHTRTSRAMEAEKTSVKMI